MDVKGLHAAAGTICFSGVDQNRRNHAEANSDVRRPAIAYRAQAHTPTSAEEGGRCRLWEKRSVGHDGYGA